MLDRVTRIALLVVACSTLACAKSEDRVSTLEGRIAELERKVGEQDESLRALGKLPAEQKVLQEKMSALQGVTNDQLGSTLAAISDIRSQLDVIEAKTGAKTEEALSKEIVKSGVKACDEYLAKYMKCISSKVPAAARESMLDALVQSSKAWKEAAEGPAREGLENACKASFDAAKQATESMGCEW
jgi:uncharacterized coiled-coil protein SlyX